MENVAEKNQTQAMTVLTPAELYRAIFEAAAARYTNISEYTRQAVLARAREDGFGPKPKAATS